MIDLDLQFDSSVSLAIDLDRPGVYIIVSSWSIWYSVAISVRILLWFTDWDFACLKHWLCILRFDSPVFLCQKVYCNSALKRGSVKSSCESRWGGRGLAC